MFKRKPKPTMPDVPSIKVALILDNTVLDVLHVDERLGAILLSEPVIRDVTNVFTDSPETAAKLVNAVYDPETGRITTGA
jgi:hypothetical protein